MGRSRQGGRNVQLPFPSLLYSPVGVVHTADSFQQLGLGLGLAHKPGSDQSSQ